MIQHREDIILATKTLPYHKSVSKMSSGDISSQEQNEKGKLMNHLNNYIIVDVGANLTNKKFSRDLDAVIQRAKDAGRKNN